MAFNNAVLRLRVCLVCCGTMLSPFCKLGTCTPTELLESCNLLTCGCIAAFADHPAPTKPTRRTTRKSSVGDPAETAVTAASDSMPAAAVDTAAAADAATPARRSRGRSSTKTSSMAPAAEATAAPTAAAAPSNRTTKAKLLAHQLAQKTLSTPAAAAAPVAAAAVTAAPAAAAIPESGAVLGSPDAVDDRGYWGNVQLHVGSQAQSDSLIMEGAATEVRSFKHWQHVENVLLGVSLAVLYAAQYILSLVLASAQESVSICMVSVGGTFC